MNYKIYILHFISPIHFGKNILGMSEYTFCSDSLFSSLCVEAAKDKPEIIGQLVDYAKSGNLLISDMLPYLYERLFLPKPYIYVDREQSNDASVLKKAYKKLTYIAMEDFDSYVNGEFDVMAAPSINSLGKASMKISASVRNEDGETTPYEVGIYSFNSGCGLYFIASFGNEEIELLFDSLFDSLSLSGIGGKKSSGYGRFEYEKKEPSDWLIDRLTNKSGEELLLSTALPDDSEMDEIQPIGYGLIKRSGFVTSYTYSKSWQRKKDVYMFKAGSCFMKSFLGDVFNVSDGSCSHPVYRYGIPLFMRVRL